MKSRNNDNHSYRVARSAIAFLLVAVALPLSAAWSKKIESPLRPNHVKDALANNQDIYYFGLGSNMSRKKLENRGINNTKIEVKSFEAAVVPNYRLAFNLRGFPPLEPGMGSLEPCDSNAKALMTYDKQECHGALVKLTAENYKKVMASEGVSEDAENPGYEEIVVDAFAYGCKKSVKAVALRARPHVRLNFDPSPSARYMNILKEGAKELNLKPCYQDFLARLPVHDVPKWQKKYVIYNLVCSRLLGSKFIRLQSKLLFLFYAPASAPVLARLVSGFMSNLIIFPGFLVGFIFCKITGLLGRTPVFVTRMKTMLGVSDD
jgi:hypothetical protein